MFLINKFAKSTNQYLLVLIYATGSLFSQEPNKNLSISYYNGLINSNILTKKFSGTNKSSTSFLIPNFSLTKKRIYLNVSPTISKDSIVFNYAYIKYEIKDSELIFGRFHPTLSSENHEISSGSMIESRNTIPIPRIGLSTVKEFKGLKFKFELYHGLMEKNNQITKAPFLHDKKLYISKDFEKWILSGGLHQVTIWGGGSKEYGIQPSSFEDFVRVFFGDKSKDNRGTIEDQGNALGDVRGMWDISLRTNTKINYIKTYYQIFFEDKSGLRLNRYASYFDGLFGLELKYNNQLLLVERLKTTYQGGSTHPPGVDSYYYTRAYPPGWVYKQRTIGNAFISPLNNRVKMLYLYYNVSFDDYNLSFGHINGKYFYPFTEKIDYTSLIENEIGENFKESFLQISKKINSNLSIELIFEKQMNELSSILGITFSY